MGAKRRVLITGGSGFLGRHLALRLRADGHEVALGARSGARGADASRETGCRVVPLEVARIESVRDALAAASPDLVIHAAAMKRVDRAEAHPHEAVDVNVVGSQNVARVARDHGVSVVVGISTDKATAPARTVYGLSKALMERMFCALDEPGSTRFTCVRLGNIAWSTGSVLTEWREMLDRRGVVGTTAPDARRFIMTAEEAVELTLSAVRNIDRAGGRVLVRPLKAVQIGDLLQAFLAHRGGDWERLAPRPYDAYQESLVCAEELGSTARIEIDGRPHFLIAASNGSGTGAPPEPLSTSTAERLNGTELERLVANTGSV